MQITETLAEGLKREYQITITGADLEAKVNEKLVEAQPEIAMKGFRKGKVPMALLKKQFGPRILGGVTAPSLAKVMRLRIADNSRAVERLPKSSPRRCARKARRSFWVRATMRDLPAGAPS